MSNDFLNGMFKDDFGLPTKEILHAYETAAKLGKGSEFLIEMISGALDMSRICEAKYVSKQECIKGLITHVMLRIGVYTPFKPLEHEQTH